jgi:PBP1b-binding outer membrane lipoprotein LpoB
MGFKAQPKGGIRMKRFACIIVTALLVTGCPPKPPDDLEKEKLKQDLEEARSINGNLKLIAGLLIASAVIALIAGVALGSKAKEDGHGG